MVRWGNRDPERGQGRGLGSGPSWDNGREEERPLLWDQPGLESGLGLHWGLWRVLEKHLSLMG